MAMNNGVIRPYAATTASTAPSNDTPASARATGKRAATSVYETPWTMPAGVVSARGISSHAPTASSSEEGRRQPGQVALRRSREQHAACR